MIFRLLIVVFLLVSCASKQRIPDHVMKPGKMQEVLRDMLKADGLAQEINNRDTSKRLETVNLELYNSVYAIHSITKRDFDTSFAFYEKHPSLMFVLMDSLEKQQSRLHKARDRTYKPDSTLIKANE